MRIFLWGLFIFLLVLSFFVKMEYITYRDDHGSGRTLQVFEYRF